MSLSIITPHYNNFEGLKTIYEHLRTQSNSNWEWIIVDDFSEIYVVNEISFFFESIADRRVILEFQKRKTNASVCRNRGAYLSNFELLVFLDSDDEISSDFVQNRVINVMDFVVFKNMKIINEQNEHILSIPKNDINYLNSFLNAKFIWQTTAILWQKSFYIYIGGFNENLTRLQDVEITVKALYKSNNYKVLDNPIDFYYKVVPIRKRNNLVKPVCCSILYFINNLLDDYNLSNSQRRLIIAYYYMGVKYLERSGDRSQVNQVKLVLKVFFKKHYFGYYKYLKGLVLLYLYEYNCISDNLFLKLNRYLFKTEGSI